MRDSEEVRNKRQALTMQPKTIKNYESRSLEYAITSKCKKDCYKDLPYSPHYLQCVILVRALTVKEKGCNGLEIPISNEYII